ncbi:MAG TPA: CopD family protein [Gemmatimonadales bacterium]|nr:CopD family protein [Gemmatimonadales bacterium]
MNDPATLLDAGYAAARWGWYLSVFLLLGAGGYAPFLFRRRTGLPFTDPDLALALGRRAARIGLVAGLALLLFTAIRLYLQARTLIDPDESVSREILSAVLGTSWGQGWERQAALALLAALAFGAATAGSRLGWMVGTAAGGGLGLVSGMTGHAVTQRAGSWGWMLDAAHVWAGGFWLGGLAVMLIAGVGACRALPDERRTPLIRALVGDFSRRALVFGPLAIGLGVWLAIRYLGWNWPLHLFDTVYGTALAVKLGLLVVIGGLGAYNWKVAQPGLTHARGEDRFRKSGALEAAFGGLLLLVTAVLVALPLPGEHP